MARLGDGRRILAVTVIATLAMAAFITWRLVLQIVAGDALDRVAGQLSLVLTLVAVAGSMTTSVGVLRWQEERGHRRAIRGAIAMAIYLGVLGASLYQLYMLVLAAAFGLGAYLGQTQEPATAEQG